MSCQIYDVTYRYHNVFKYAGGGGMGGSGWWFWSFRDTEDAPLCASLRQLLTSDKR